MAAKSKSTTRKSVSRPKRSGARAHRRVDRLRESAEQFRLAQEQLGIVTWIWDIAADRVQWYGDTERLLGLPPRAFSGRYQDYLKYLHPDDVASSRAVLADCLKGKRSEYRTAERVVWPDGSIHWLETWGSADYGPDGRAVRMTGVVKDITERKRQESARERAEKQLARVFDASPDYMLIVRANDRCLIAANAAFERVTGYRPEDVVGRNVDDLNLWSIPGERERFLADLLKQGWLQNRPVLLRARDGSMVTGKISASLIEHEGEKLIVSQVHDVSAAKELERRARQSESKFAALFEHSPEAISLFRVSDGMRLEANAAWERLSGHPRKQVEGRPAMSASLFRSLEHRAAILARIEAEGAISNVEVPLVRADGSEMDALLSGVRFDLEGEKCVLWSWRDVTVERETARRARRSEHKFQALFATSPAGLIVTLPRERKVLEINDAALRILGLKREEAVGAPTLDLVRFLDRPLVEDMRARALTGESVSSMVEIERRDGRRVEVLASAALVDVDREPHFMISILDVTEQRRLERQRNQAERKYAALFDSSPDALVVTRMSDGLVLAVNEAWERYVGFRRDAAVGRPVSEFAAWIRPEERAEIIAQLAREGRLSNLQTRFKRADGTEIDVLVSAAPIELEGEPCAIWAWRDVTDQLRLERERHEADARYRALFETSLDGMVVGTPHNTVIDANPAACAMTGYSREELVGKSVSQLFHADDLAKQPLRRDLGQRWSVVERRLARKGGGEMQVEIVAGPMPDGNVLAMMRDITERKRSETLLMNIARGVSAEMGERFFRSLAGHLARELGADFAFIGELTGGGTQIRPMAFLMDGALVAQAEHPLAGSMSEQALAAGRTVIFDKGVRERFPGNADMQKEGVEAYVGTPLHGADGVPLGVLAVGHRRPIARPQFWASMIEIFGARAAAEIERSRAEELVFRTNTFLEQTVQERTSQLEEANRELESYSYSISHDLRQPLNAIGGFAELLREEVAGELSPTARDFVAEIENNSARMQQMIESLLELSRAGRSALHKSAVDARQVVHSVLHDLAANGALKAEVQVGELPAAAGDAVLLRQVWVNLIGNALKYSGRSPAPRVEIGGRRMDGMVEYSVRDNGVGFDMQHADRLFGAFQRLPTSAGFTGSGIGLAIVERIVQRHGGSIRAESMPGKGATFRFTLPDSPLT